MRNHFALVLYIHEIISYNIATYLGGIIMLFDQILAVMAVTSAFIFVCVFIGAMKP